MSVSGATTHTLKRQMRKHISALLNKLSPEQVTAQSDNVARQLFELPVYRQSKSIAVFLSMPKGELDTSTIVRHAFQHGKTVYVPRVTDKKSRTMEMLQMHSADELKTFERTSWGIPEPPLEDSRPNLMSTLDLDLLILPGLAFDVDRNRLGHGRGFYDTYVERLRAELIAARKPAFKLVGLALSPQMVERVPMDSHDVPLDAVVFPHENGSDAQSSM